MHGIPEKLSVIAFIHMGTCLLTSLKVQKGHTMVNIKFVREFNMVSIPIIIDIRLQNDETIPE